MGEDGKIKIWGAEGAPVEKSAPKAPKNVKIGAEGAEKGGGMGGSGRICTGVVIWEDFIEILSRIFDFIENNDFFLKILGNS